MGKIELLFLVVSILFLATATAKSKPKQRSTYEKSIGSNPTPKSAIIAIQIIDEDDEKTGGRNAKRTIDSALGYGYQGQGKVPPPKFQIYKYSQHDIPPYNGPPLFKQNNYQHQHSHPAPQSDHIQPGTTLFSTINQNGQIGEFTTHLPQGLSLSNALPIPVIILRILPAQLQDPSGHLYPNIPSTNSFANVINSLDIKSLLNGVPQPINTQPTAGYQTQERYYQQQHPGAVNSYVPAGTNTYSQPVSASLQVGSHQRSKPSYVQQVSNSYLPTASPSYHHSAPTYQYQEQPQYQQHQEYQQYPSQEYQQPQQYQEYQQYQQQEYDYDVDPRGAGGNQYLPEPEEKYQEYQQYQSGKGQGDHLLTHENYPSDKHTRVIFKDIDGNIRSKKSYTKPTPVSSTTPSVDYEQSLDYEDQHNDNIRYVFQKPSKKKIQHTSTHQQT